VKKKERKCVL
jgi:myo-inositol-1(or 4)-monophosphatase